MWKIEFNHENKRYYLVNTATGEERIVPELTEREIKEDRYQRYYDKAYTMCEYLNGSTVYHTRKVNNKKFIYKMRKP